VLRVVVVLGALLAAPCVHAQVSGSVTLSSDYRFRGVSLSDDAPALQVGVVYDAADGWYAGASAANVRVPAYAPADAQLVAYFGYARRVRNGLSWEVGAEYAMLLGASGYDYPEFYVGLASDRFSGRLYYAPRYFGDDESVVYAELNGTHRVSERTRLLAHLGWLHRGEERDGGTYAAYAPERNRLDARVGLGVAFEPFDLQIAWVMTDSESEYTRLYPVYGSIDRGGWVLSLSRSW